MLVYGDRIKRTDPAAVAAAIGQAMSVAREAPAGIVRHGQVVGCLIMAGELVQGLADAAFEQTRVDEPSSDVEEATALALALARVSAASWRGSQRLDFVSARAALDGLGKRRLVGEVRIKSPEGFAFYALYPEAYWEAARRLGLQGATVIGLRSIGASLGPMVAAAVGDREPITLRPVGHPFDRRYQLSTKTANRLAAARGEVIVVDEGPGMSGSSFCAAGEQLEALGIRRARHIYIPSHAGSPGPAASPEHKARWDGARRVCLTFDDLMGEARGPAGWFEGVLGRPVAPLVDISGGAWRQHAAGATAAPVFAAQERRKFLLRTAQGEFLLKFIGLGALGQARFARARQLGEAGFAPQAIAWRHGFIAHPWLAARSIDRDDPPASLVDRLGDYLAFRAKALPAPADAGASMADLAAMARHNVNEGLRAESTVLDQALDSLTREATPIFRIHTDGRLHAWEWLATDAGPLIKTDALDHDDAHDLVGCQDIAWDLAGARAEFGLGRAATAQLCRRVEAGCGRSVDPNLLTLMDICYAAFQLGYWTLAHSAAGPGDQPAIGATLERYRKRLVDIASAPAQ